MSLDSIARNRFGLGARPDEPAPSDPRRWLLAQLDAFEPLPAPWQAVERTPARLQAWFGQQRAVRAASQEQRGMVRAEWARQHREAHRAAVDARTASALQSATPFVERLVHFWANHFAVSVDKPPVTGLAGSFELDAIRPHVLGRFEDMLLAAVRHPAMLLYLDQVTSTGPNSVAGQRAKGRRARGLNENLAREILELHTLGARSGYTQDDVTEFARALTGWTLPDPDVETKAETEANAAATFRFAPALHEPGPRRILGNIYTDAGEAQARAILHTLATAPATARHIATKLTRHVVGDDPPPALVERLANAFTRSGGDLPSLYRALIAAPEAWQPGAAKFKSPWDWTLSSLRALGRRELPAGQAATLLDQLGQPVWRPGSPAGYGDLAATWAAPGALLRRVETAQRLARQVGDKADARALAPRVLPGALDAATAKAIAAAESPANALALLLASPAFLRR